MTLEEIDELFDGEVHSKVLGINDLLGSGGSEEAKVVLAGIDIDEATHSNIMEQSGGNEKYREKVEVKDT